MGRDTRPLVEHDPRSCSPKAPGAAGLLLGLLRVHLIGVAAASGLVVLFVGAILAHLGAWVFHNIAFPGAYLALAGASLVLAVTA